MDEPTASLSDRETRALLQICKELRAAGVSILYVSHRLEEIFTIADRVTVLRDGAKIETRKTKSLQHGELVSMMVGRTIQEHDRRPSAHSAPTGSTNHDAVLSIDRLTRDGSFRDISLSVRRGEVVGLAGLVGAGRSEVVKAIFGIDAYDSCTVTINGEVLPGRNPRVSADRGIALVPEDRQHEGLVLQMSITKNISFAALKRLTRLSKRLTPLYRL